MTGQTISHYRILDKLGEGGMGVVYKAEDTKLERTVALKFLAAHLLNDQEAKQRFLREAKSAAALHHPNICTVHEIDEVEGKTFLAMAFLKGETLEERIAKGPLPLKDALDIGKQVAEGLAAAHAEGIVHRDIKPANILVSPEGRATIMDFGLARLTEASKLTRADQTVGTAAYMSPEQIQGADVDPRTDVWALGCVLYEMVAGVRPFKGQYDQALAYEIVHEEPEPLTAVRAGLPMELEFIVGKCLAKDGADRYQNASDIARDLRTLGDKLRSGRSRVMSAASLSAGVPAAMTTARTLYPAQALPADTVLLPKRRLQAWQAAAALFGLAALFGAVAYFGRTASEAPEKLVRRFSFTAKALTGGVISPDGRYIAYNVMVDRNIAAGAVWLRSLENETSRQLPGTEGAHGVPFWSPDSLSIGFVTNTPGHLKRVSIDGGTPTVLCEMPAGLGGPFNVGTWSPDGERIVFVSGNGLYEIVARGGRPRPVPNTKLNPRQGGPHFVPTKGGPPILVYHEGHSPLDIRLMALDMASGEAVELGPGKAAFYSPEGYLIHGPGTFEGEGLWALPFSPETMKVTGEDFPVSTSGGAASVSRDGAMAYSDSQIAYIAPKTLVWRNRAGEIEETVGQPQLGLREFSLSPDGRFVATTVDEPPDIWIQDLVRSTVTRLTFDPLPEYNTSWTASGREVAYTLSGQPNRLMLKAADGTGEAAKLADFGAGQSNADWSRDGRFAVYSGGGGEGKGNDIFYVELDKTGGERKSQVFLSTPTSESIPKLSPDGRFVAYVSDESGKHEIYIRPFPSGSGRWQASVNGGKQPRWRRDGKELFFVEEDIRLMAVSVASAGEGLALGRPERLFESPDLNFRGFTWPEYDVSLDGQRFLTSTLVDRDVPPTMRVVLNWFEPFRNRERE